jgi:hypothetical protein
MSNKSKSFENNNNNNSNNICCIKSRLVVIFLKRGGHVWCLQNWFSSWDGITHEPPWFLSMNSINYYTKGLFNKLSIVPSFIRNSSFFLAIKHFKSITIFYNPYFLQCFFFHSTLLIFRNNIYFILKNIQLLFLCEIMVEENKFIIFNLDATKILLSN